MIEASSPQRKVTMQENSTIVESKVNVEPKVQPTTIVQAATANIEQLVQRNLEGDENAFQKILELAIRATKEKDWVDLGGNPYCQFAGNCAIALRFGISLSISRNNLGDASFSREEFTDEDGLFYTYTVTGQAKMGSRTIDTIGTCSTRDQFLGMEGVYEGTGPNRKKVGTKPVPLHESTQDAKKKAVTNLYGRLITSMLGIKGFTWEELSKYGVKKGGKTSVDYSKKTPPKVEALGPLPQIPEGRNYWATDYNGKRYLWITIGNHFTEEWADKYGFRQSKNPAKWSIEFTPSVLKDIDNQWTKSEVDMEGGND